MSAFELLPPEHHPKSMGFFVVGLFIMAAGWAYTHFSDTESTQVQPAVQPSEIVAKEIPSSTTVKSKSGDE